jgi:hypothetical protein
MCHAVTISFDSYPQGLYTNINTPYATFTATSNRLLVEQNGICPFVLNCENDVFVDFVNPVNNLTFQAFGYDAPGDEFTAQVVSGALLVAEVPFTSQSLVDLSSYSDITELNLLFTGQHGYGGYVFNNFSFAAVPIPSAMLLFISGLAAITRLGRSRTN